MAQTTARLSALKVDKTKEPGMYAAGGGRYLKITNVGTKNWVYRFMLNGQPRWMGIDRMPCTDCRRLAGRRGMHRAA